MLNKLFSKLFSGKKEEAPAPAPAPEPRFKLSTTPSDASRKSADTAAARPSASSSTEKAGPSPTSAAGGAPPPAAATEPSKDGSGGKPKALLEWEASAARQIDKSAKAEELCGIKPDWSPQQIRDHLAMLYRRHNRAASSLDARLREEAETMLDAIVRCREKLIR